MAAARANHYGDAAGVWNAINRELWAQLGMRVPVEAVRRIREIRARRRGKQGNTEMKRETKILLAIRDGVEWSLAEMMEIDHVQSMRDKGEEKASNLRLVTQKANAEKGARSIGVEIRKKTMFEESD